MGQRKRLNDEMKGLIASEKQAKAEHAEMKKEYDSLMAMREQAEQQMITMRDCVTSTEHELEEKIKFIEELTKQKNEFGNAIHTAENRSKELELQIVGLEKDNVDMKLTMERNEELKNEIAAVKTESEKISQENTKYVMKANELQNLSEGLRENVGRLEANLSSEKHKLLDLEKLYNSTAAENSQLKDSLKSTEVSLQEELSYMTSQLSGEAARVEKLQTDLEELHSKSKLTEKRMTMRIKELKKELGRKQLSVSEGTSASDIYASVSGRGQNGDAAKLTGSNSDLVVSVSEMDNRSDKASTPRQQQLVLKRDDSINSEIDLSSRRGSVHSMNDAKRAPEHTGSSSTPDFSGKKQPNSSVFANSSSSSRTNGKMPNVSDSKETDISKLRKKIKFYEENTKTMVEDIQRKAKIIQMYILRGEAGTLLEEPKASPLVKGKKKNAITTFGDFFKSSKEGSSSKTPNISQELAVQISKKTQMVLEDVMLKNMQLQDNLDTLATELSKLRS